MIHPMNVDHVRSIVHELAITWHVRPELSGDTLSPIGHVVELTAMHGHVHDHPVPGCPECQPVTRALLEVAEAVAPHDNPFPFEIHVDTARHGFERAGPSMAATITILRRDHSDAEEREALAKIVAALRRLGAAERV